MKIFWSWQSDHPGKISRHFVRDALEAAIKALNEDLAIEEPEREATLDHDRKGVPGSPDLASTILQKIQNSDVVVADVTPVGATSSEPPKQLINSNVAIELGYALRCIGDQRLIMVMNSAFGSLADLPFDLRHKAGPIVYELASEAGKADIETAKKKLAGELKTALREMLPLINAAAVEPFAPAKSIGGDPSRYFKPGQVLVNRRPSRISRNGETQPFIVPDTSLIYLRIMPARPFPLLKRAEAIEAIKEHHQIMRPFYRSPGGGSSFEANEFGALAFEANFDEGKILCGAQLFVSREIWAFDTVVLSPDWNPAGAPPGLPSLAIEEIFAARLPNYLKFMNDELAVPPPYSIEGGAANVNGHFILMPNNYFNRHWGPIHQDNAIWSGTLSSLDLAAIDQVLLNIFEAIFDAASTTRPKGLYKFPGETPGAMPKG
jgi:hypothetical protein